MGMLESQDDGQKPLFRKYVRLLKKQGAKDSEISDIVETIRLSGSGEWILIECQNCTALLHADSKVGQSFWEAVNKFEGLLKALEIIPAKGKLGFDIQPSSTAIGYWNVDNTEDRVEFSTDQEKKISVGMGSLSLEAMTVTSPSVPISPKTTKGK